MKPEDFTPIGRIARTQMQENPRVAGNNAGRGGAVASQQDTARVVAWMAKQAPHDMDKAAELRARQHGVGLTVRSKGRYPTGPNGEYLPSYSVAVGCAVTGTQEGVDMTIADMRNFLTPAPVRQIEAWLAELSVIVAKRVDDELNESLRLEAYSSRLLRYPADVVCTVLVKTSYKFWPTWEELERRCEAMASPRRNMLAALERWSPETLSIEKARATEDERARIAALVAEQFPTVSSGLDGEAVDKIMALNEIISKGNQS